MKPLYLMITGVTLVCAIFCGIYIAKEPERKEYKRIELMAMCNIKQRALQQSEAYAKFVSDCNSSILRTHTVTDDADEIVTQCRYSADKAFPEVYEVGFNVNKFERAFVQCKELGYIKE